MRIGEGEVATGKGVKGETEERGLWKWGGKAETKCRRKQRHKAKVVLSSSCFSV